MKRSKKSTVFLKVVGTINYVAVMIGAGFLGFACGGNFSSQTYVAIIFAIIFVVLSPFIYGIVLDLLFPEIFFSITELENQTIDEFNIIDERLDLIEKKIGILTVKSENEVENKDSDNSKVAE